MHAIRWSKLGKINYYDSNGGSQLSLTIARPEISIKIISSWVHSTHHKKHQTDISILISSEICMILDDQN